MEQPTFIDHPTPSRNMGKRKYVPTLIVLHHTGGHLAGDLATLCSETGKKVSADFEIAKNGDIYKLNPQLGQNYTFHAGVSAWNGRKDCNKFSFGIEQEHIPGEVWTDAQVESAALLCAWLIKRYGLDLSKGCIQSHAAVATPKGRKTDPEKFPWDKFGKLVRFFLEK